MWSNSIRWARLNEVESEGKGKERMNQSDPQFDVAIIGLGPVGSMAALLLSRAGLTVAAIEQEPAVYALPRAVNLDGELVRAMQPLGLAEDLDALLQHVRPGERAGFANSKHEWLFGDELSDFGPNGWQSMNMFDQPEVESFLRTTALGHENVTGFVGYEAVSFEDRSLEKKGDYVSVIVARDATQSSVTARYLIACDGAASPTRKALDIGWHDLGYNHDWLVVDITTKPGHTLGTTTMQVCDPDRISTYVCTKDPYRRWEFKLNPGETWEQMLEPATIKSLIEPWTAEGTYEIRRAAMYQFHAATADTWRIGHVFIAGDAAHQTPPFLGQGMNAGLRDVVNLSWKLELVKRGIVSDDILDAYQAERDAHAHDLVEWAVSIGQLMEHLASTEGAARAGLKPPPMPEHLKKSGYGQGRGQPPLRDGMIMNEQVGGNSPVGYLFSQPIIAQGTDQQHLDDLLGPGFAVVALKSKHLKVSPESNTLLAKLGAKLVSLENLELVRGHFDRGYEQTPVIIVRPDRYIFGIVDERHHLDNLVSELAARVHLN